MILGIGNDIIEIDRIRKVIENNERFILKYFTLKEQAYFSKKNNNYQSIAGNFAAKEAVSKALGTGFRKFGPSDVEVLRNCQGAPVVFLYGQAEKIRLEKNIDRIWISISHGKEYATAVALAERN